MKNVTKIFALVLAASMLFILASCAAADTSGEQTVPPDTEIATIAPPVTNAPETDAPAKTVFTVNVKDSEGNAMKDIMVQVCTDTMCYNAFSDANGVAVFSEDQFAAIGSGYTFVVAVLPEGYTYEYVGDNKLYLEAGATELEVVLTKAE